MRIALVTADHPQVEAEDFDRPFHVDALGTAGMEVAHPVWSDPAVDWGGFDLIVIRTTWDYTDRLDEFHGWLDEVEPLGTVHNPPALIRWNLNKRYLFDLEERGVPIVPTIIAESAEDTKKAIAELGAAEVVVKPVVSASSRNTGRFVAADPAAVSLAARIIGEGNAVMIQPSVQSVATHGETALMLFGGEFSHAIRKGPLLELGGGLLGGSYEEEIVPWEASEEEHSVAVAASRAATAIAREAGWTRDPLLYARIDVVTLDDGTHALLEAELFEPSLFLNTDPASAGRFARVCRSLVG